QLAHPLPGFPERLKLMLRPKADERLALQLRNLLPFGERIRHGLAMHFGEFRFVVERLNMRRPARLIEKNHALGFSRMMQRLHHAAPAGIGISREQARVQQGIERQDAETRNPSPQKSAPMNVASK